MKAIFSLVYLLGAFMLLGGCLLADPPPPAAVPVVVAPVPVDYSCDQQRQLATELAAVPGSMIETAIGDYGTERRKLRAVLGQAEPAMCPPAASSPKE